MSNVLWDAIRRLAATAATAASNGKWNTVGECFALIERMLSLVHDSLVMDQSKINELFDISDKLVKKLIDAEK